MCRGAMSKAKRASSRVRCSPVGASKPRKHRGFRPQLFTCYRLSPACWAGGTYGCPTCRATAIASESWPEGGLGGQMAELFPARRRGKEGDLPAEADRSVNQEQVVRVSVS